MNMGTDGGDERWLTRRYVTKMREEPAVHRVLPGTCRRRQMILTARSDKGPFAEMIQVTRWVSLQSQWEATEQPMRKSVQKSDAIIQTPAASDENDRSEFWIFLPCIIENTILNYRPGNSVGIAGRSGIESRWGRDFPPVQTGPGAHPASCKMGTGLLPGVKCGRGVLLTTHPLLVPRSWKSRAIPLPTLWATPGL